MTTTDIECAPTPRGWPVTFAMALLCLALALLTVAGLLHENRGLRGRVAALEGRGR